MRGAGRNQQSRAKQPGKPSRPQGPQGSRDGGRREAGSGGGRGQDRYAAAAGRGGAGKASVRKERGGGAPSFAREGREAQGRPGRPTAGGAGGGPRADRSGSPGQAVPPAAYLKLGRRKGDWMEFRVPEGLAGAPIPQVLKHTPLVPKLAHKLLQAKGVVLQGTNLRLQLFAREKRDFPSDWMELNVLYEDDFTLVVNKPSGYEVHPSEKGQRHTLAHAVAAYYEMTNQDVRIRHIHRIDKETTGPVLYAKNEFAHYQYDKEMREKKIERIYLALAEGELPQDKGTINLPIGQDRHHSTRRRVSETGDPAITHYEVVQRYEGYTLVRLRLETGRTHQIRVHMAAIGHPLAGDGLYGGKRAVISRQALHGERLIWHHPWTGERLTARAPLPEDFEAALAKLEKK
ncbi:RluA family pseudouridine synthase [Cohnella sp. REN36]|uniref:RluA family pseudouridine synthase n=1 Tax=Cohnella sp. REN36 TaxID=2887347 RepID=UPI001D132FAC|nr:RluA family pseudouridine synthase [Cohnella sp. REN36]MCC3375761.1 RluA family pseudouridine synthase [Cohnella sp. REN36]